MVHEVSRRSFTEEALVRCQVSEFEICVGQSGTGTAFPPTTSPFPCQYHSNNAHYHLHLHVALTRRTKRAKTGKLPKCNDVTEIGKH